MVLAIRLNRYAAILLADGMRPGSESGYDPFRGSTTIRLQSPKYNIARREPGSSHLGNGCDLRIRVTDGSAERTTVSSNPRKNSRSVALETEDAACQILGKHSFRRSQQAFAALALAQQFNPIKDFCFGD
jgi:hypothetical protein